MLSEFAGAAQSLGAGAILVNPWNITDMAAAIQDALTMSEQVLSRSLFQHAGMCQPRALIGLLRSHLAFLRPSPVC